METWVKNYKDAVWEVYDQKLSNIENLMNGVEKERENMYNKCLDNAIDMVGALPPDYAVLINQILNTSFTDKELYEIAKPHIEAIRCDIREYISKNADSRRKFNNAQEMRKELDEAKAAFENLKKKPTLWQRVKNIFCRKKS